MSGSEYINLIGENLLKSFDSVYLIDVMKDSLYIYNIVDNYVKLKSKESFLSFLDKEKRILIFCLVTLKKQFL